jgi:hypothetical protein
MLNDSYISPTNLARFLNYCQRSGAAPYVHKAPIAYPTKAKKDNWRSTFVGAANLDTYCKGVDGLSLPSNRQRLLRAFGCAVPEPNRILAERCLRISMGERA